MSQKLGLVAGWGDYPVAIARRLCKRGIRVYCVGVLHHANEEALRPWCTEYRSFGLARLGQQARFFRRRQVHQATMAGKIFKTVLFQRFAWLRHLPDLAFLRHFSGQFITRTADANDDTMLLTAVRLFASYGIEFLPATNFAPELLVKQGNLTRHQPSKSQMRDIAFGWNLAKRMGGLDVGQSVAVKGRAVLAVEAVEGTDQCIQRAGQLCPAGGFTVVKVAKPDQDMRFDVPTVGVGTLETMRRAGASVLAIEADKTIVLEQQAMIDYADRHRIAVVAVHDSVSGRLVTDTTAA
jgi:DUF1009 family protein